MKLKDLVKYLKIFESLDQELDVFVERQCDMNQTILHCEIEGISLLEDRILFRENLI